MRGPETMVGLALNSFIRRIRPSLPERASGPWRLWVARTFPGDDGSPYLTRITIAETPIAALLFHIFHRGDEDLWPHDHRWWFITIPLLPYVEERWRDDGRFSVHWVLPLIPLFRRARHRHRVILPKGLKTYTIVIRGPERREWGFWIDGTKFVESREFIARRDNG